VVTSSGKAYKFAKPKTKPYLSHIETTIQQSNQNMSDYYPIPFPFDKVLNKEERLKTDTLEASIRANIRFCIMTRVGEFAYDRNMGFEMWEHDKKVFYHEKEPYYEEEVEIVYQGLMENAKAQNDFTKSLKALIQKNELRLEQIEPSFEFKKVGDDQSLGSVYQRRIEIVVKGRIKSTGQQLHPPYIMEILYTPFLIESNI